MSNLTIHEAADYLNVTTSYIEQLISTGHLITPITRTALQKIKKASDITSQTSRIELAKITRHYDMGY